MMQDLLIYSIILVCLFGMELLYFRIANHFNIVDKPNERSSHATIVLRGGGIIFTLSMAVWAVVILLQDKDLMPYLPFLVGLVLIAGVSFVDDINSLPDSVRLVAHFSAMMLMFWSMDILHWNMWWIVAFALIVCVGATNIFNFMDGINGITAGYSMAVLVPLLLLDFRLDFIEESYLIVSILGVLVFGLFNFRPKGKAKCFAGDVGSIGIAFILLYAIGRLIEQTGDVTYLALLLVYGIDGCLTILHRVLLHENLGEAHRKHAYQIMANELGLSHPTVSLLYSTTQLVISLVMVYLIPDTITAHWVYLIVFGIILCGVYILFMKKFYHLHKEYLDSLKV